MNRRRRALLVAASCLVAGACLFACESAVDPGGAAPGDPDASDGGLHESGDLPADGSRSDASTDGALDAFDGNCGDTDASATNCGACGHSCLGEACVAGVCAAVEIQTGGGEIAVMTDPTYAYWVSGYGDIFRRPLSGAPIQGLNDAGSCTFKAATLDLSRLYWTCSGSSSVGSAPIDGGLVNVLATSVYPTGIAIDATNAYWCDGTRAGGVFRAPKATMNGGAGTPISNEDDPYYCVRVQVGGGQVYWLAIVDPPDTAAKVVRRAPIGGGTRDTIVSQVGIRSFAIDGAHVYWSVPTPAIMRSDRSGANPSTLVANEDALQVVVDGADLYWGTTDGRVRRARTSDGKGILTLAAGFGPIGEIAVGPQWVVFLADGKVLRVAR